MTVSIIVTLYITYKTRELKQMGNNQVGYAIIASAVVWGIIIIACSSVLSGTQYKQEVINYLIGGASFHLLFIWGPLGSQLSKKNKESGKEQSNT